MAAVVQLVSAVGSTGTVLMDLNAAPAGTGAYLGARGDVSLADVALAERAGGEAFRWTPAVDGGAPSSLASRQITVPFVLVSNTPDGAAVLAGRLQQLLRARFVLKLQRHGSTVPVWLRCAPCVPVLSSNVAAPGQPTNIVTGTFTATTEPYALGARVDVGPATITQNPATGGAACTWDVTGVGGDSPTPLVLRTSDSGILATPDRTLISIRSRGLPSDLDGDLFTQAEGATVTLGTAPPTVAVVSDAALSSGSGLSATYSAPASGPWTATVTFPGLTGVEAPGVYRLLVRIRRTGAAAGQLFSLVAQVGPVRLVEAVTAGGNDTRIVDLGLVQVPIGQPPFLAAPESPLSATAPSVALTVVKAAAGGGTFDLDWVALIPADQDCGSLEVTQAIASGVLAVDGWSGHPGVFSTDPFTGTTPAAVGATGLSFIGGPPRLRPGSNRLYVVAGLGTASGTARSPGLTLSVSGSFWPRYGWLG